MIRQYHPGGYTVGILGILGALLIVASLVGWIIILIDAFKNEVLKGLVGFFCGLYLLYYAIVEYQAENKWMIVGLWLAGGIIGGGLLGAGGVGTALHTVGPVTP
jgi:hypothetical protein